MVEQPFSPFFEGEKTPFPKAAAVPAFFLQRIAAAEDLAFNDSDIFPFVIYDTVWRFSGVVS